MQTVRIRLLRIDRQWEMTLSFEENVNGKADYDEAIGLKFCICKKLQCYYPSELSTDDDYVYLCRPCVCLPTLNEDQHIKKRF